MKRLHFAIRSAGTFRLLTVAALGAALGGCGGGGAPLFTRDGRPTTQVQCPAAGPWDACTENARGICEGDFDVIQQSTTNGSHDLLFACRTN